MSRADDKIKQIYENAKAAMKRLSDKNYHYAGQDSVYDDLRQVQKLIDSFEEGEWYWENEDERQLCHNSHIHHHDTHRL